MRRPRCVSLLTLSHWSPYSLMSPAPCRHRPVGKHASHDASCEPQCIAKTAVTAFDCSVCLYFFILFSHILWLMQEPMLITCPLQTGWMIKRWTSSSRQVQKHFRQMAYVLGSCQTGSTNFCDGLKNYICAMWSRLSKLLTCSGKALECAWCCRGTSRTSPFNHCQRQRRVAISIIGRHPVSITGRQLSAS